MSNLKKYNSIFVRTFEITAGELDDLTYRGTQSWDSIGHMSLIAAIEDAFDIMMEPSDMIELNSYKKGIEILSSKYDIEF